MMPATSSPLHRRGGAFSSLIIPLLAFLLAAPHFAVGQTVQSGLLYWCSMTEGGTNMAVISTGPGTPPGQVREGRADEKRGLR